jgi:hypothetical protein
MQYHFYWHNGGTGGYTSSMILDVENKNGIIILSNTYWEADNIDVVMLLTYELDKIVLLF